MSIPAIDTRQPSVGIARDLLARAGKAVLATQWAEGPEPFQGAPYASLVVAAADVDGSPLLLLSDLSQHARNLAARPEASLLYEAAPSRDQQAGSGDDTAADPLTGPRVTLIGTIAEITDVAARAAARDRYLAQNPAAALYADFGDFRFYRMTVQHLHVIAGFGRAVWVAPDRVLD